MIPTQRSVIAIGYDTGVWTADEVMFPCVGQLGTECSPKTLQWTEKYLELKERYVRYLHL